MDTATVYIVSFHSTATQIWDRVSILANVLADANDVSCSFEAVEGQQGVAGRVVCRLSLGERVLKPLTDLPVTNKLQFPLHRAAQYKR